MKSKNLFITLGLAVTLGVAGLAGVSMMKGAEKVSANGASHTVYCAIANSTLSTYTLKLNVQLGDTDWNQQNMTKLADDTAYPNSSIYTATFTDVWGGIKIMQFQLWDGGEHKGQDEVLNVNWDTQFAFDNKIHVYGGTGWSENDYTPATPKYTVTKDITKADSTKVTPAPTEQVYEGSVPTAYAAGYGETFDGWYTDSGFTTPVTAITAATTVYGRLVASETATYTVDESFIPEAFGETLYFHSWDAHGNKAEWPGEVIPANKQFTIAAGASFLIHDNAGHQTTDIAPEEGKLFVRINNTTDEGGKYTYTLATEKYVPDVPEQDGYYLVGSKTGFKFAGATAMQTTDISAENDAELHGYEGKKDEEIKVRGYFSNDVDPDKWSFYKGGEKEYGDVDEDGNFVFSADKKVNIFAKWEVDHVDYTDPEHPVDVWQLNFYVDEFHERHAYTITERLFEGKNDKGNGEVHEGYVYEGSEFDPEDLEKADYAFRGFYTNEACTVEYVPAEAKADVTLYAKFTKACYYMFGDDAFLGEGHGWNVDYATPVAAGTGMNRLEGVVTIPNTADAEHPVAVKPLMYSTAGQMVAETYTMGEERTFVSLDKDGNFAFTAGGSYAFYVNNENKVYFNIGEYAFHAAFIENIGNLCDADGKTTDLVALKAEWGRQATAFAALSEADQKTIKDVGFNGGDASSGDQRLQMIAKYAYIVNKYGTAEFNDFIWNQNIAAQSVLIDTTNTTIAPVALIAIVASIALLSTASIITVVVIKRRRFSK